MLVPQDQLYRYKNGPFIWDADCRVIRDVDHTIRAGLLVKIAPEDGPKLVELWNDHHALWLLSQGASSNSAV